MALSAEAGRSLRESVWLDSARYQQAEAAYHQVVVQRRAGQEPQSKVVGSSPAKSGISDSIGATISIIQESLAATTQSSQRPDLEQRLAQLEKELGGAVRSVENRVAALEARLGVAAASKKKDGEEKEEEEEEEEDFDPFASDEEDDAQEEKRKRLEQYQLEKAKKPPLVAKSSLILDVKPWESETDMKEMEHLVRSISADGLLWGASKLVPVAYGIKKLQISCVVVDEKVGTDFLEETITGFEDHVQSVDVVAFNKI